MAIGANGIHEGRRKLARKWKALAKGLDAGQRAFLRAALLNLRAEALMDAETSWRRHKAPMAAYWKAVGVYAGHLAAVLKTNEKMKRGTS